MSTSGHEDYSCGYTDTGGHPGVCGHYDRPERVSQMRSSYCPNSTSMWQLTDYKNKEISQYKSYIIDKHQQETRKQCTLFLEEG